MREFHFSNICTLIGLLVAYKWAGWDGVAITAILILMEISLSFDNAVVNATILKNMSVIWRKRFMTWGDIDRRVWDAPYLSGSAGFLCHRPFHV